MQNRKGAIRPGLDADLVFFDPNASFVVTPDIIAYKNKVCFYDKHFYITFKFKLAITKLKIIVGTYF